MCVPIISSARVEVFKTQLIKSSFLQGNCSAEVPLAGMSPCASHSKAARRLLLSPADGWRVRHHSARAFWMVSLGCRWAELLLCVWEENARSQPKLGSPSKCVWKGHLCQRQHSFQLSQALSSSWPLCNPGREWGLQASLKFPPWNLFFLCKFPLLITFVLYQRLREQQYLVCLRNEIEAHVKQMIPESFP